MDSPARLCKLRINFLGAVQSDMCSFPGLRPGTLQP